MSSASSSTGINVGDIFYGYESYGGSGHSKGLFKVTSIGKMYVSLCPIESEGVGEVERHSTPADSQSNQTRKAVIPTVKREGKSVRFSLSSYDHEDECGLVDGASMCYTSYTKVKPNEKGEFVYSSGHVHNG